MCTVCHHWEVDPPAGIIQYKMQRKLQDLPTELLEFIIDHLPSRKDRRSLWKVSKSFRELLASRVFETLTIRAKERALLQLDKRPYNVLNAADPLGCLKLVKHLHLKALFHEQLDTVVNDRCPHAELHGRFLVNRLTRLQPNDTVVRMPKFIRLSTQLQENSLLSFSWDLGMCIPGHVLGREGYLTRKQTTIESLSLITAGIHEWYLGALAVEPVVLSNFPQLRKFSWKRLHTTEELDSLRDLFASNYRILEDLELDFISWSDVVIDGVGQPGSILDPDLPSFTDRIMPHYSTGKIKTLRSLKRLALSAFEFEDTTRGITQAFNIPNLQVLKLHNCAGILTFLLTIVSAGLIMRLKSLELIIADVAVEHDGILESPLINFLQSFEGLEEIYLMLRAESFRPKHWPSYYWNAILHHKSSLKRLIYHERRPIPTVLTGTGNEWVDNGLWRFPRLRVPDYDGDFTESFNNHIYNTAVAEMQLQCLGIADPDYFAGNIMTTPLAAEKSLKLLHVRRTGTDPYIQRDFFRVTCFEDQIRALSSHNPDAWSRNDYENMMADSRNKVFQFARLVFLSPKFDNLEVLAFGDFSHENRYQDCSLLLCRTFTPNPEVRFRLMSTDDIASYKRSGVLNVDFLTACPRNSLVYRMEHGEFP